MSQQSYTRSKGQVLHRFEPGSVATIPVGTIKISRHDARKVDDLGKDLQDAVRQELTRWKHLDAQMDAFRRYTAECVFVTTQSVKGRRLDVRECAKCGAVRNIKQWKGEPDAPCHHCGHATLNEVPFVFAHADGTMVQLTPRFCSQHSFDYLVLERGYQKRWRCKVNGCNHAETIVLPLAKQSIMKRPDVVESVEARTGKPPSQMMALTNVSDNKLQVVHSLSRINPTPNVEKFLVYSDSLRALLAVYLSYFNGEGKSISEITEIIRVFGQETQEDQKELEQLIKTLQMSGLEETTIQTILVNKKQVQESEAGGPVVAELRKALNLLSPNTRQLLGDAKAERETRDRGENLTKVQENARTLREQLSDYAVLMDLKRKTLDDTVKDLRKISSPFCDNLQAAGDLMRKSLGISQVAVIQDLPVLHLAYGYTRLSHQPEASALWAFDRKNFDLAGDEPKGNWIPMPVYKLTTEALLFQFDAKRIVKWLHANNLAPDPASISEPTLWLLERHCRITSRSGPAFDDNLSPDFLIPWLVSSALHSANHLLIKAIADQSSFGETALSEHLLFSLNQTIIFVNRLQEFSLGGLKTFFEQRLDQAFQSLLQERGDCMFDPYCEETLGGACNGCLHLPEVVCRLFNNALSRILLYGGEIGEDMEGVSKTLWHDLHDLVGKKQFIGLWDSSL
jgi:DNA-binding transcriptional MerR regulator